MSLSEQKQIWFEHYKTGPQLLKNAQKIKGLVSAFNANIDAVVKLKGTEIARLIADLKIPVSELHSNKESIIKTVPDVFRGLVKSFSRGIAEEWIIDNKETFLALKNILGTDKLQMGGQGGIVANVAAVCGVNPVYVHCASLPKVQAELFLDLPNLFSFNANGTMDKVTTIDRNTDIPLIHYILEFDNNDVIELDGETIVCPKSNRFIATFDPLNLQLHIDEAFDNALASGNHPYEVLVLSGYQLLQAQLPNGLSGVERINESINILDVWRKKYPNQLVHFEAASTQDKEIRRKLVQVMGNKVESVGVNERELIDLLEVTDKNELAEICNTNTHAVNLFKGLLAIFEYMDVPRIQLHMFGLYVTLQKPGFRISGLANRNGMQFAALIAAAKAGTGSINSYDVLMHAINQHVSDIGLKELNDLSDYITSVYGSNTLAETGMFGCAAFDLIAVPTIIIEKPVTLVGMGDTISSASLIGALAM